MDGVICLTTYDILRDIVKKLMGYKNVYTENLVAKKYPSYFKKYINLDEYDEAYTQAPLHKLQQYAEACNKACTLDLSESLIKLLLPLFYLEKILFSIITAEYYDDNEDGNTNFFRIACSQIITTLKVIRNVKKKLEDELPGKTPTYFEFIKFLHPVNLRGYSSMDARMYLAQANHRLNYNLLTPNVYNKQVVVYRGGTRKHKHKVTRTLHGSHKRRIN
jgi:hypothetical protein